MKKVVLFTFFLLTTFMVRAQQVVPDLTGTDFWMSFLPNYGGGGHCSLLIASAEDCTVHVEGTASSWSTTATVSANQIKQIFLPSYGFETNYIGGRMMNNSWHITTSAPASVYASNYLPASHDMTALLPTSTLRREYMTQTYASSIQEVAVVAPYDSTELHIIFTRDLLNWNNVPIIRAGTTRNIMLRQGDVYQILGRGFSGTRFLASKPVAVFEGNECATVPNACAACDHLYEQSIPTEYWGQNFVVMPTAGRNVCLSRDSLGNIGYDTMGNYMGDLVLVTALHDNCVVVAGDRVADTLAAGESYTFLIANRPQEIYISDENDSPRCYFDALNMDFYQSDALFISTSEPATVFFYITGIVFGGDPGDPASVVVPPVEQGVHHAVTAVYNTNNTQNHYVNILTFNKDTSLVTLDGNNIASEFTATTDGISWARMTVDTGVHVLDADTGLFVATFYGIGYAESYAYIASTSLRKINYVVLADHHSVCPGDTVTVVALLESDSLSVSWKLDGVPLATSNDTVRIVLDSVGKHYVTGTILPIGIEKTECIIVNPVYSSYETDTICSGDSLLWHQHWVSVASDLLTDTLQSIAGCDSITTLQLVVLDVPHPSFSLESDCLHSHHNILVTVMGDTMEYDISWQSSPPDDSLEVQLWDSLCLSPSATTTYRFSIAGYCPFDTAFTLSPIQWPEADMEVRPEVLNDDHLDFEARDVSGNAKSRHWWVDGRYASDDPVFFGKGNVLEDSLLLTLVALNESCADTLVRVIPIIHSSVWVPNVFTPDGRTNNLFAPVLNGCTAEDLYIYNRQGLLVAHVEGNNPSWDGTRKGEPCPQGTYVYAFYYYRNNEPLRRQKKVGTVTLLR